MWFGLKRERSGVRRQQTTTEIEVAEIRWTEKLDLGRARFYSLRQRVRSAFAL
jgi:hypothetical protein